MRISVTGAMGTGKSTLVDWLVQHLPDYQFFSVDKLVAKLYEDRFFTAKLQERFGVSERKEVSRIVFENAQERAWLEHLASERLCSQLNQIYLLPNIVVEFPLLFEVVGAYAEFDLTIATWCPADIQRERIFARDSRETEHTERMLAAQFNADLKAALADVVVDMSHGPDERVLHAIKEAQVKKELKRRCEDFFGVKEVWPVLSTLYDAPERVAHSFTYLAKLLSRFDAHRALANNPEAVELAIWFHAAGLKLTQQYYRQSPARSAQLMWKVLSQTAPRWLAFSTKLPLATELISSLSTATLDSAHLNANQAWRTDCALFLDLMMLQYAQSEDVIQVQWQNTLTELSGMAGLGTNMEAVLLSLLARPRLLLLDALHVEQEAAVRQGIETLLKQYVGESEEADEGIANGHESSSYAGPADTQSDPYDKE